MMRRILAVLAGLAAALVCTMLLEGIQHAIFPIAEGVDYHDAAGMQRFVDSMPAFAFVGLLIVYAVAAFVGGYLATRIAQTGKPVEAVLVGALFMIGGLINLTEIRHPTWFVILNLISYVPMAYLGYRTARGAGLAKAG